MITSIHYLQSPATTLKELCLTLFAYLHKLAPHFRIAFRTIRILAERVLTLQSGSLLPTPFYHDLYSDSTVGPFVTVLLALV